VVCLALTLGGSQDKKRSEKSELVGAYFLTSQQQPDLALLVIGDEAVPSLFRKD